MYSETKKLVTEFYEREEVSRICPGKKDCISIKLEDRSKVKVQKRLLLANFNKIYSLFKSEFSNLSIGFSTFALLRPKWCMSIGVSGSHNVYVCTYNQNVKLMVHAIIHSIDYKDVLKLCVCDMSNQNYMLHHCDFCPSEVVVRDVLKEQLQSNNHSETINYKQWFSIEKSQLVENEEEIEDFLEKLLSMLHDLTEHHFTAKNQSNFFKEQKAKLKTMNVSLY